jgi:hypothetical protein
MTGIIFKLADSVVVKQEVLDPDFDVNIGGWQGRISEISEDLICISWDSITLQQMPRDIIDRCEQEDLDWAVMYLAREDVELTSAGDSQKDVDEIVEVWEGSYKTQ